MRSDLRPARGGEGAGSRLISSTPVKHPLSSGGGGVGGDGLDGPAGHDLLGELLLGLGEAGPSPPVLGVDLGGRGTAVRAGSKIGAFPHQPTIFRRMTARTAFTVKKPATTIITTATGRFVRSMLMEEIQPLSARDKCPVRLFLHSFKVWSADPNRSEAEEVYQ